MNVPAKPMCLADTAFLAALFLVTSLAITTSTDQLSATFDEPYYLNAGLTSWRTGSNKLLMKAGTMPLPVDLQTLPLYLAERSRDEPYQTDRDFGEMLPTARRMNLFFWLGLLVYGWRLGTILGGSWAGRASAFLLATEPNLLAHAGLATTDVAVTAGVLAAAVHFLTGRNATWAWRVLVPGLAYGVALLCKASALAYVPIVWAVLGVHELVASGTLRPGAAKGIVAKWHHVRSTTYPLRRDFVWQFLIAMVVTFAYCGSDWKTERTFVEWARGLPSGTLKSAMVPASENLTVFTNAGEALAQQVKHNFRGHGAFVLGHWHERAVWYYFPVALAAKLTIPALFLVAWAAFARPRSFFGPAGWVALSLLLFSFNCRVQIGIRLVFPLVAFLLIAAAVSLARPAPGGAGRVRFVVLAATIAWQAALSYSAGPDRVRSFNPFAGGFERGHEVLSDSNADWGQGLFELSAWNDGRNAADSRGLSVVYFGTDPRSARLSFRRLRVESMAHATADDIRREIGTDDLAISTSLFIGNPRMPPGIVRTLGLVEGLTPVARVGPYLVYRLP